MQGAPGGPAWGLLWRLLAGCGHPQRAGRWDEVPLLLGLWAARGLAPCSTGCIEEYLL